MHLINFSFQTSGSSSEDNLMCQIYDPFRNVTGGDIRKIELVVCVASLQEIDTEICSYIGTSRQIKRIFLGRVVTLREARTGQILASQTFQGTQPPLCPGSIGPTDKLPEELRGGDITATDVVEWLKINVSP